MKHFLLLSLIWLLTYSTIQAQMTVDTLVTPEDLIKKVLLGGNDVKVGNIKFTGHISSAGYFENAGDAFSVKKGIVLSTGRATSGIGPNSTANKSELLYTVGDEDLENLCQKETYDAAVLEFDFVPLSNKVSFQYIFASEEYPEFTGSKYNDVFAFFISGPAISGQKNMAVVPRTEEIVSINTISQLKNTDYFIDNNAWKLNGKKKHDVGIGFLNQELLQTSEFDGMTIVLTAETNVIPFKKYHFKMAIADVSDKKYNSAVYLKGGSFKAELDTTASDIFLTNTDIDKNSIDVDAILNNNLLTSAEFISKDFTSKGIGPIKEKVENKANTTRGVIPSNVPQSYDKVKEEVNFSIPKEATKRGTIVEKEIDKGMKMMLPAFFEPVYFQNASFELSNQAENALGVLIKMLEATPEAQVKLSGHACSNGSTNKNLVLSENRAKSVMNFLAENGISQERIQIEFFGENQPLSSNYSKKGKEQNRRVEILLTKI